MALTEEQQENIRKNRERALEIRRKREEERRRAVEGSVSTSNAEPSCSVGGTHLLEKAETSDHKRRKVNGDTDDFVGGNEDGGEKDDIELEDFEIGASTFVTKREAMQTYCLPEGTMAVCSFVEKENPRQKGWSSMKLYDRAEIRRRARDRHGGIEGLAAERKRRAEKRLRNDLETTKDIFKRN
uniref:XPA C-terminal domain-containing protein n=1 Tax=Attheya septentrionalis TaxID=420275 RepID=A0A7S2XPB6_9STRA|mmetsp:Transcript_17970/g.32578  ORF Transcript_17970/g.32578 Transcript_17970/m.32578 type:complete len:184 (+) Transcript_17970:238-789(+)